jgi:hypothetical protein
MTIVQQIYRVNILYQDTKCHIFFKRLIDDYEEQKNKVCYLFIGSILRNLDSSLYDRLNEIKYFVMLNDFVDDDVMNNLILNRMINANAELYENTQKYVTEILSVITPSVNMFDENIGNLYNFPTAKYPNALFDYCTKYIGLNRYSFLHMYNEFTDIVLNIKQDIQPVIPQQMKTGINTIEYPITSSEQPLQRLVEIGGKNKNIKHKATKKRRQKKTEP